MFKEINQIAHLNTLDKNKLKNTNGKNEKNKYKNILYENSIK